MTIYKNKLVILGLTEAALAPLAYGISDGQADAPLHKAGGAPRGAVLRCLPLEVVPHEQDRIDLYIHKKNLCNNKAAEAK